MHAAHAIPDLCCKAGVVWTGGVASVSPSRAVGNAAETPGSGPNYSAFFVLANPGFGDFEVVVL